MYRISAYDKKTEWLVTEYELVDVDWSELRNIVDTQDEFPTGDYLLDDAQLEKLRVLTKDPVEKFDKSCDYALGEFVD